MKNLFLFLIAVLLLESCRDRYQDDDTLPPATQEGKNTGGALVNGKVWVAKIEAPYEVYNQGYATTYSPNTVLGEYILKVVLRESSDINNKITLYYKSTSEISVVTYTSSLSNPSIYDLGLNGYLTNDQYMGTVTISKFDKVNEIVSGTFNFKAVDSNGNVITVTDGRFDKKFIQ